MSDELEGTRYGGKPGEVVKRVYDGDRNKISIYNGQDLKKPAIGIVPYDPKPEQITLDSIAHACGMTCRFAGHTRYYYSVAQHLLYAASHVPPNERLRAALHDASEAYLTDIPSPYKMQIPGYKETEAKVQHAIGLAFGIPDLEIKTPAVADADYRALGHEANSFMPTEGDWYGPYYREAIANTAHLKPIQTFNDFGLTEEEAIAESMRVAAYAIGQLKAVIRYEIARRDGDFETIGALNTRVQNIYNKYRFGNEE